MESDRDMFEARHSMDALTTSSGERETGADRGRSGEAHEASGQSGQGGQGSQGEWSWFASAKPSAAGGPDESPAADEVPGHPSRTPTAIRPVGTGAERERVNARPAPPPAGGSRAGGGYEWPPHPVPEPGPEPAQRAARAVDDAAGGGRTGPGQPGRGELPRRTRPAEAALSQPSTGSWFEAPSRQAGAAGGQAGAEPAAGQGRATSPGTSHGPGAGMRPEMSSGAVGAAFDPTAGQRGTEQTTHAGQWQPFAAKDRHEQASAASPPARPAPETRASVDEGAGASPDAILIRRTMAVVEPVADKATSYFYALLFLQHPELRELFPAAMDTQRDRLFRALMTAARNVDDPGKLTEYLSHLGRGHRKYGTRAEHYPAVGECLIGALTRYASEMWNEEVEAAWVRAYTAISQIMIDASAADELTSPPWWEAEIVEHERRTSDIAVITVRPDQPYPFLAGQYTSMETPWWPRVWRHYSFASAPRPDGLLSFHVKAVPAGWVSSAIVNRARVGDIVRLGPPAGSMTVNHTTDNGLLCLGGGTGIAPIKALVEDVAEHGRRRTVEVFYGARYNDDLYDLDTMLRLQQEHPWLSVRPVVSQGATSGLVGQLPEIVRQHGPWHMYDAYLSGPPGMIRSGVEALVGIGMPAHRIRHDSLEELVSAAN